MHLREHVHLEVVSHYEHIEEQIFHHNNLLVLDVSMDVQYDPIMVFQHIKNLKILVSKTEMTSKFFEK